MYEETVSFDSLLATIQQPPLHRPLQNVSNGRTSQTVIDIQEVNDDEVR